MNLANHKFISMQKSRARRVCVCVDGGRRENKRLSILRPSSSGRESHPVQEVFLPSRWAATEMKISHLNFFAFVSLPSVTRHGVLDWWYRVRNLWVRDNSDATPCHPALISDDETLALSIKAVIQPSSKGTISSNNLLFFSSSALRIAFLTKCDFW